MRSLKQIRRALKRLTKYHDSRQDILDATHEDRQAYLQASLRDDALAESLAFCESLEWVLEINSDPDSENRLEHLLRLLET